MMFETPKYVQLPGRGLASLYIGLMVALVLGNMVYLFNSNAHVVVDQVEQGFIFAQLEEPTQQPLVVAGLEYCGKPDMFPCQILDPMELVESFGGTIFVMTGWYSVNQSRTCEKNAPQCESASIWRNVKGSHRTAFSFSVRPEDHILSLEHSLGNSQIHGNLFSGNSREYTGFLQLPNGSLRKYPANVFEHDGLLLRDLLEATGIYNLDEQSDYFHTHSNLPQATFRQSGVALQLHVRYSNLDADLKQGYRYTITRVPETRVRKKRTKVHEDGSRTLTRLFGIQISVVVSGSVGTWTVWSAVNGLLLPSIAMTSLVYTIMYYAILYLPACECHRSVLVEPPRSVREPPSYPTPPPWDCPEKKLNFAVFYKKGRGTLRGIA